MMNYKDYRIYAAQGILLVNRPYFGWDTEDRIQALELEEEGALKASFNEEDIENYLETMAPDVYCDQAFIEKFIEIFGEEV